MSAVDLLAVVGPTASGKTALAIEIARAYNGEIICADSRTIYRGMDIGTAKPTKEEEQGIPHHLLDIRNPDELFSAAEFKALADQTITEIRERGKLPIVVGGTGLYISAVLYNYQFPAGASGERRNELERLPLPDLVERLQKADPERAAAIDLKNPRRVIRALETAGLPRVAPRALPSTTAIVGLAPEMKVLEQRIAGRTRQMLDQGLVDEVQGLLDQYHTQLEPFNTVGYAETIKYIMNDIKEAELAPLINLHTRQLAKRQMTWLKRNPDITWAADQATALKLVSTKLNQL